MNVDFITFITRNSSDYAEYLKFTAEERLSGKHNINWKCIESVGAERLPEGYECVAKSCDADHNSKKHAEAMNLALNYIESDYVIFIDSDVAILYHGWDDVIVNKLNKYNCFGGAYGESKDKFNISRYKKFPTVNFFAFRADILDKVKLDFYPFKDIKNKEPIFRYNISNKKESKIFGIKRGKLFTCDTGWKLPLIFSENKLSSDYMPMFLMNSKYSQLPFEDNNHKKFCFKRVFCMNEWHYNNKLFATHKKLGRHHTLDGKWGTAWKRRIDLYIKEH